MWVLLWLSPPAAEARDLRVRSGGGRRTRAWCQSEMVLRVDQAARLSELMAYFGGNLAR